VTTPIRNATVLRLRHGHDRASDGQPRQKTDFMTGFLTTAPDGNPASFARPMGLAQLPDGSLLVGDHTNGVL
jgi:glucose/arabinose dehydrogenase